MTVPDSKPISETAEIENLILQEVNSVRESHGYSDLVWNEKLAGSSRSHSNWMALPVIGFFRHSLGNVSENIAYFSFNACGSSAEEIADCAVQNWYGSPDHKENMLGDYSETGVGVAKGWDGYYFTEQFE